VFASPVDFPQLVGKRVADLAAGEQMETLRKKEQAAAKMAAEVLLKDEKMNESDTGHTA